MMNSTLQEHARAFVDRLLIEHPVIPGFADQVAIIVVGSLAAGFADKSSDVDLWVLCADEVSESMASGFQEAGLRFDQLPPEELASDGAEAHYFAFPVGKLRYGLEVQDNDSLFFTARSQVMHDPAGLFAALRREYGCPSDAVVREKVGVACSRVIQIAFRMRTELRRFQPLCWLQNTHDIAKWALELCCWLDGQAPVYSSWLARQAESCSTADIIVPAVSRILRSVGPAIEAGLSDGTCASALQEAADALGSAANEAVDRAGYGDVERWSPPEGQPRGAWK